MKILIVADKNGTGHVKPFPTGDEHPGEGFWIASKRFTISKDSRIKLGKKFMKKYGFTRSDGRRAIIIDTGKIGYGAHVVHGARILTGSVFIPWYEKNNGYRLPIDVGVD